MFEKEAMEYERDYKKSKYLEFVHDIWKNGAEFGYKKAIKEIYEDELALQSDMDKTIEQNILLKKQIEILNQEIENFKQINHELSVKISNN